MLKAALHPSCSNLIVRVPEEHVERAREAVRKYERAVFQTDQELQLKNAKFRYLRLLPGDYELVVHSLVSGEKMDVRQFTVEEESKKTQNFTFRLTREELEQLGSVSSLPGATNQ